VVQYITVLSYSRESGAKKGELMNIGRNKEQERNKNRERRERQGEVIK
jgi:hypothetical protein